MLQRQEETTNRLIIVIQAIQLDRGTGLLKARRGTGITQEEGTILFTNGQVTQASVGRRSGTDALNWLSTWGICYYVFIETNVSRSTQPLPAHLPTTPSHMPAYGEQRRHNPSSPDPLATHVTGEKWELKKVPMRVKHLDEALRWLDYKGLSRSHRLLLFYVDGIRKPEELALLMKCSEKEIQQLLHDLESVELVQALPELPGR